MTSLFATKQQLQLLVVGATLIVAIVSLLALRYFWQILHLPFQFELIALIRAQTNDHLGLFALQHSGKLYKLLKSTILHNRLPGFAEKLHQFNYLRSSVAHDKNVHQLHLFFSLKLAAIETNQPLLSMMIIKVPLNMTHPSNYHYSQLNFISIPLLHSHSVFYAPQATKIISANYTSSILQVTLGILVLCEFDNCQILSIANIIHIQFWLMAIKRTQFNFANLIIKQFQHFARGLSILLIFIMYFMLPLIFHLKFSFLIIYLYYF